MNASTSSGSSYGSPNGAFPMANGDTAITEINGDWLDVISAGGQAARDTHPPGFTYPSDTNEVRPGLFLSADYTSPGAIETFTGSGELRWRYAPTGAQALNQPSLALPLPNGDILANDDKNDRVIVIDPHTNRIVWQYGHTDVPGSGEGFLSTPTASIWRRRTRWRRVSARACTHPDAACAARHPPGYGEARGVS